MLNAISRGAPFNIEHSTFNIPVSPPPPSLRENRHLRTRPYRHLFRGRSVPRHAHGDALDDLHEIARGVVGGEEGERRAGSAGEAFDLAFELAAAEGVDADAGALSGVHLLHLRLLEVR